MEGHPAQEDDDDSDGEDVREETKPPGVVYRMFKGGLKKLEGGMNQYEEIARRGVEKLKKNGAG